MCSVRVALRGSRPAFSRSPRGACRSRSRPRAARRRGRSRGDRRPRWHRCFDRTVAVREIEAALTATTPILPRAFSNSPRTGVACRRSSRPGAAAVEHRQLAVAPGENFAHGLITGEPENCRACRYRARRPVCVRRHPRRRARGARLVTGEEVDELVLGLACRARGDGGHLRDARRRRAGARRLVAREGGAGTGRISGRMADWLAARCARRWTGGAQARAAPRCRAGRRDAEARAGGEGREGARPGAARGRRRQRQPRPARRPRSTG